MDSFISRIDSIIIFHTYRMHKYMKEVLPRLSILKIIVLSIFCIYLQVLDDIYAELIIIISIVGEKSVWRSPPAQVRQ